MEKITRHVLNLGSDEKRMYESVLGHTLHADQQIILHVITPQATTEETPATQQSSGTLPDWCNVYDGLSGEEMDELEEVILDRSHWSRSS